MREYKNNTNRTDLGYRSRRAARMARQRRTRMLKISFLAAFVLVCISLTGIIALAGDSHEDTPLYKYYKFVKIEPGDSLWSIACDYYDEDMYDDVNDYIYELRKLNNIYNDVLFSGEHILISYYSAEYK